MRDFFKMAITHIALSFGKISFFVFIAAAMIYFGYTLAKIGMERIDHFREDCVSENGTFIQNKEITRCDLSWKDKYVN